MKHILRLAIIPAFIMSMSIFAPMVSADCGGSAQVCGCVQTGSCTPTPPCVKGYSCEPEIPAKETPIFTYTPENYENSVSFNDDDLGVTLQKGHNADGKSVMEVYAMLDHGQVSNYLFTVTQADLDAYANALPTENVLLKSKDGVSVYMLTTGEIQVNAGPDSEGKMHVKILNGIPWTSVYGYTMDPQ